MTREEHIKWCKERAIQEMNFYNDPSKGIVSMMSDLRKHDETKGEGLQTLCMFQLMSKNLTRQQVIRFIDGFN